MGDEQHAALEGTNAFFQPFNRRQIEVIGRFVEQQDVGLADQRARQAHAALPAARELGQPTITRQFQRANDSRYLAFDIPATMGLDTAVQFFHFAHAVDVELSGGQFAIALDEIDMRGKTSGDEVVHRDFKISR